MNITAIVATIFLAFCTGCSHRSVSLQPMIENIAATYTSYGKVTHKEVFVNLELAMLCNGASQKAVEAARIKHGPHANTSILIYMNDKAMQTFTHKGNLYPVGAVIVKHKNIHGYGDSKSGEWIHKAVNGVGGMVKRSPGFDPLHGDWEYFYFEDVSKIENGRIASCIQCHEATKNTDYVFGTWSYVGD